LFTPLKGFANEAPLKSCEQTVAFEEHDPYSDFTKIPEAQIFNREKLATDSPQTETFFGYYKGSKVFLKILDYEPSFYSEGYWLKILNAHGMGPHFYGVTSINNKTAWVIEFIDGYNTKFPELAPSGARLTPAMIKEIRSQVEELWHLGIKPNDDLQFLVSSGGKLTMIDPEFFYPTSLEDGLAGNLKTVNKILNSWRSAGRSD